MTSWADPRIPEADQCVLGALLERHARERPEAVFATFEDGQTWTYASTRDLVSRTAAGLAALGVRQGDLVHVWMASGPDAVRVWFAINWLGAVYVPLNLAYKGRLLEHVIAKAQAKLIVADADLAPRLADINRSALKDAVIFNGPIAPIDGLILHDGAHLLRPDGVVKADVAPWETQTVIYTSGTTGPSKGVMSSSLQGATSFAYGWAGSITAETRILVNLPLFHVSGSGVIRIALAKGASFALTPKFSTETFWEVVRDTKSTTVVLLGVMATFIVNQPPGPQDRDHTLKSALMVPLAEDAHAFKERFGADVYTVFNMTEVSSPLMGEINPTPVGTCGKVRPGVEVRLVDANDCEVAPGEIGELIVRTDAPWAMNSGYLNDPEATAKAWRNGWFHTGDAFRKAPDGAYFFVDRMKDAIRRRGENISSFEVETEVCAYPAVREAAALAVPSDVGEDDVLVVVALNPGHDFAPADLIRFLAERMAHFMVPRYIRVLADLPKTPTQKVEKHLLRAAGVTPGTFDREAHGLSIKAGKLVEKVFV